MNPEDHLQRPLEPSDDSLPTHGPMRILTAALLLLAPFATAQDADLVLTGGRIVTMDEDQPEVRAMAVKDGRVLALGGEAAIQAHVGESTRVVDLKGRLTIPGFIEGHGHFLGIGASVMQLNLMELQSWEEVVAMVAEAVKAAEPGEMIRGRGWHQEKWSKSPEPNVDGLPLHDSLSAVSPDNPVVLTHASGHATFANAKAMELSGIDATTRPPAGGEIVRDTDGNPIGAFRETASGLLNKVQATARPMDPRRMALLARDECLSKGVTSFQDAGSSFRDVDLFRAMADEGELGLRMWVMIRTSNEDLAENLPKYELVNYGNHQLTVRAIKVSIDGALGSHGAWMLDTYADLPESFGLNTISMDSLAITAQLALDHGWQLGVHAIGDRANREVLDLYSQRFAGREDRGRGLRWRIEHAQHIAPEDVPRFGQMGVIASMQGVHCTSDAPWVYARLGEERAGSGAYVWRDLVDSGAVVTNGTDAPVEDVDPIASFYATVTRQLKDGSVFFPDQRLSRLEALRSYTLACAYAAFEEEHKGSLSPGKLADFVVLSGDILDCPEDRIRDAKVLQTYVGGELLYSAKGTR